MAAYTTIDDPEAYFQVKTYSGNGGTQSITLDGDTDMQPDLVIMKSRSEGEWHNVVDSVRGVTKYIYTNATNGEGTTSVQLTAFDSDGFSLGSGTNTNNSGQTYVAWCWKTGTAFSNDASATSVGNTDSSGSASSTAGFSIATYAGVGSSLDITVKHGLSVAPAVMWIKNLSSDHWAVYHHKNTSAPETDYLKLSDNTATTDDADAAETFLDTAPTSAIATFGDFSATNRATDNHVGYFWNEVQGFSKFGRFIANNQAGTNGTFVYLGFRARYFLWKNTTTGSSTYDHWNLIDTKRQTYNGNTAEGYLQADEATAETGFSGNGLSVFANGVQISQGGRYHSEDGSTYIYMAFAEAPFVNSNGVPGNAK